MNYNKNISQSSKYILVYYLLLLFNQIHIHFLLKNSSKQITSQHKLPLQKQQSIFSYKSLYIIFLQYNKIPKKNNKSPKPMYIQQQQQSSPHTKGLLCEQLPVDTIIQIDDHFNQRTGFFQLHDIGFEFEGQSYGSEQLRQKYGITKDLKRYFSRRYFYFTMFDEGIELDRESWYSVIAEPISLYLCGRLLAYGAKRVFQPFSGVGGIAVHAAGNFEHLTVNDIDPKKIKMLKNNLSVYGKGLNLLTIHNKDYCEIKPFPVDAVIICPPWGGIDCRQYSYKDLDQIMNPRLSSILNHCKKFSKNMVIQLPKNTNLQNLLKVINLNFLSPIVKIQRIIVSGRISQLFVYIGDISFTAFNPQVYKQIIKHSNKQIKSLKQYKKDLKNKIATQNFQIFNQIYKNKNFKKNKHIFFDQ